MFTCYCSVMALRSKECYTCSGETCRRHALMCTNHWPRSYRSRVNATQYGTVQSSTTWASRLSWT